MSLNLEILKTIIDEYLKEQLDKNIYDDCEKIDVLNFINNGYLLGYIANNQFKKIYSDNNKLASIKIEDLFLIKYNEYTIGLTIYDEANEATISFLAAREKSLLLNRNLFTIIGNWYLFNLNTSIIESIHYYKINRFQFSMIKTTNNIPIEIIFLKENINSI